MVTLFFIKALFYREDQPFYFFFEEYFDYVIQVSGYICYIIFTRHLIGTRQDYPALDKAFRTAETVLFFLLVVYSAVYFCRCPYTVMISIENGGKYFLLGLSVFYVIVGVCPIQQTGCIDLLAGEYGIVAVVTLCPRLSIIFRVRFSYANSFLQSGADLL